MLTPALLFTTATTPIEENLSANNWDSEMGVEGGETLKYNFDQILLPSYLEIPENITLPDLNNTQLYVKVMAVEEDIGFDSDVEGTYVTVGLGLIFPEELAIGLAFDDLFASEFIIPAGAATPSLSMSGVPHFNTTFCSPVVFLLNLDWSEHEVMMEDMGLTIDNGVDEFTVTYDDPLGGGMEGTWRKSDGVLTHILFDDVIFQGMNLTDTTIEISLDSMELNPLDLYEGQVINLNAEQIDVDITMTGDFEETPYISSGSTFLPFTDQLQEYIDPMIGQTVQRIVIDEIEGTFYKASVYVWDIEDEKLYRLDEQVIFNGFLGSIPGDHTPLMYTSLKGPSVGFWPGPGPAITSDWDIYEGELLLMNTAAGVYINELFEALGPNENYTTINSAFANMGLTHADGYYYFQEEGNANIDENYTSSMISLAPQANYDTGENYNVTESLWLAYTESGIFAGAEIHVSGTYEFYDENDLMDEGTIEFQVDIRIVNPDYNPLPPENIPTGGFPGFTLMIVIPVVVTFGIGLAIYRKKRQ